MPTNMTPYPLLLLTDNCDVIPFYIQIHIDVWHVSGTLNLTTKKEATRAKIIHGL